MYEYLGVGHVEREPLSVKGRNQGKRIGKLRASL